MSSQTHPPRSDAASPTPPAVTRWAAMPAQHLWWVSVALIALAYAAWHWAPMHQFAWKYDEGIYVQEALLQLQGHRLYEEIWSERPPLFSLMLAAAFKLLGPSILVGRSVVLATAAVTLLGLALLTRHLGGRLAAALSALLLALMPHFYGIASMILIELPPVAFALLSLGAAAAYRKSGRWPWLAGSALSFAISGLIKPVAAPMYIPLSLLILLPDGQTAPAARIRRWLALNAIMALPVALVMLYFGPGVFMQNIVGTLFAMREEHALSLVENASAVWAYFTDDKWGLSNLWLVALAALGWAQVALKRRWVDLAVLGSWLALVVAALMLHTPIRRHHLFLLLPALVSPAAIALAGGFCGLRSWRTDRPSQRALTLFQLGAAIWLLVTGPALVTTLQGRRESAIAPRQQTPVRQQGIQFLTERTPLGSTVICDDPMLPFLADRDIPPQMAAPSFKRVQAGSMAGEEMVRLTQQVQPSAIVFWERRFERVPGYLDWVRGEYVLRRAFEDDQLIFSPLAVFDPGAEQPAESQAGLGFLGSHLFGYAVEPGGSLTLDLYWIARAPIDQDYAIFVHLLDDQGGRWGAHDLRPLDGRRLTSQWLPGERLAQEVTLQVDADAPPGEKVLAVGMYGADHSRVDWRDGGGRSLGDGQVILTPRPVVRWPATLSAPQAQHPEAAELGGVAKLVGWDGPSMGVRPGGRLDLTLHWTCTASMRTSYVVFVHLVDVHGQLVAQSDGKPGQGRVPTTGWIPGEYLVDLHQLEIPGDATPGTYSVQVGLYDLSSGERLPVQSAGQLDPNGMILLSEPLTVLP